MRHRKNGGGMVAGLMLGAAVAIGTGAIGWVLGRGDTAIRQTISDAQQDDFAGVTIHAPYMKDVPVIQNVLTTISFGECKIDYYDPEVEKAINRDVVVAILAALWGSSCASHDRAETMPQRSH